MNEFIYMKQILIEFRNTSDELEKCFKNDESESLQK